MSETKEVEDLFTIEKEICPHCGSEDIYNGYGMAAGGMGGYKICLGCDKTLAVYPDEDASTEEK